ncbi:efflux RND transporter permease subunit, partial [Paraburkholderia sp. SIMBA_027]
MPVLASLLLRGKVAERESRILHWVRLHYEPILARGAQQPALTMGLAVVLLAVAAFAATRLGAEFLPRLDEGALTVTTTKLPG